jgi:hypothetical protein
MHSFFTEMIVNSTALKTLCSLFQPPTSVLEPWGWRLNAIGIRWYQGERRDGSIREHESVVRLGNVRVETEREGDREHEYKKLVFCVKSI